MLWLRDRFNGRYSNSPLDNAWTLLSSDWIVMSSIPFQNYKGDRKSVKRQA